ncbi:hypothetical protein ACHHYP_14480 [Achlya hypogyna]|uniref:F-box domain-containing protein n=1 Tax=Achlya hypogyna TaxID=1202772 RepID=A0A1V9YD52_ACHHY|nr:hypothetical protein ACHHYP_14480 [Achlya hypogyna]
MNSLPSALVHDVLLSFLDAPSLGCLGASSRAWAAEVDETPAWRACVQRRFDVCVEAFPTAAPRVWRAVFTRLVEDAHVIARAASATDVLILYKQPVALSPDARPIHQEIILMQGLRRFPSDVSLLQAYAAAIRASLVVQI